MICATHDIILLNKRLDKESRSEVYVPTQISGVAVYEKRSSSNAGSYHGEDESYVLRIPEKAAVQDGRTYIPGANYTELDSESAAEHWTIRGDDIVIVCSSDLEDVNTPIIANESEALTYAQIEAAGATYGYQKTLIHITWYADNTRRGSAATRHWRIGCA